MEAASYEARRLALATYFDQTAAEAWSRLTSDAPVGRIRATVRAGRDEMRRTLLGWLPADLRGRRLLDAGCGTGALAVAATDRGARVVAVDLAPTLVGLARERSASLAAVGSIDFRAGDMLDPALGRFDHVVAMDSLIHYAPRDLVRMVADLAARTERSIVFTFAPRTPWLAAMLGVGRLFPRGSRSPAVEPIEEAALRALLAAEPGLEGWRPARAARIARGFYISHAVELERR
jgi:magnesium-protoporphyrin O-methyltransferase